MIRICKYICIAINVAFVANVACDDHLTRQITPTTSPEAQERAVRQLMERVIGTQHAAHFVVAVNKSMQFRSYQIGNNATEQKILISGWDAVAVAKGFHFYLKYVLGKDISWFKSQVQISENETLPLPANFVSKSASDIIYYQNVCTWSYSFAWWTWSMWRRHIDWMAMMGISLSIAPIQEQLWHDVYIELGLSEKEITAHFAGPAFQPWQRMGNIRGWGGPLPKSYRRMQKLLQHQLIQAQRALGISVALPAFAGHVPVALARLRPNATFTPVERWNDFPAPYCCSLFLEPNEPLFADVATRFLNQAVESYGSDHIYFCDPFNEMQPRLAEANYLYMTASNIYKSMQRVDAKAIWLLQGWMFVKNLFWKDELIEAFLTAVPRGQMLVLDLQSEQFPQYQRTQSYYGQPFVWCMLHNFGGTLGMFGSIDVINTGIQNARQMPGSTMVGMGITAEGINQNYAIYALALERGWESNDFDLEAWFTHYARVRYGTTDTRLKKAWQLLSRSVYSYYGLRKMRGKYTITRRPALNLDPWTWYNATNVLHAWHLLLLSNDTIATLDEQYASYEYDLVDITRQYLQTLADRLYVNLKSSYRKSQPTRYVYLAEQLMELFDDLETILATNVHFLLGPWLESAKQMAISDGAEESIYEFNARNQITTWGPSGQILDYATKQWAGIVCDYYRPRWQLFLNETLNCLLENRQFNSSAFKARVAAEVENPFSLETKLYPVISTGQTWQISKRIYDNWNAKLSKQRFLHYNRLEVKLLV